MGNRGSKSDNLFSVNEQRVDGSYCSNIIEQLRCTLMGPEMGYQSGIPSNLLQNSLFSTTLISSNTINRKINPWFITGFVDAEGCFSLSLSPDNRAVTKYSVSLLFVINLHIKDIKILQGIQQTLGVGRIYTSEKVASYRVKGIKNLAILVDHFSKYPLVSTKAYTYELFKQAFLIIAAKEHLKLEGLAKLVALKSVINSEYQNMASTFGPLNLQDISISQYIFKGIPDAMWVAGFVSGDGSFFIKYNQTAKTSYTGLNFGITLHIQDKDLVYGLYSYLQSYFPNVIFNVYHQRTNKGVYYSENVVQLKISNLSDICNIIIPFFDQNPVQGLKNLDFTDFKKVAKIISTKNHLTQDGLTEIANIRDNMNRRRKVD
jgi:hypothetical protein